MNTKDAASIQRWIDTRRGFRFQNTRRSARRFFRLHRAHAPSGAAMVAKQYRQ